MMLDVFKRFTEEISETKKGAQWEIARLKMFERFSLAKVCLVDLRREHFESYIVERSQLVKLSSINREFNGLLNTVELNVNLSRRTQNLRQRSIGTIQLFYQTLKL